MVFLFLWLFYALSQPLSLTHIHTSERENVILKVGKTVIPPHNPSQCSDEVLVTYSFKASTYCKLKDSVSLDGLEIKLQIWSKELLP